VTINVPLQVLAHPVEFLTEGMLIRGHLHTARRVTDIMNEVDKFVRLTDVKVWPVPTTAPEPVETAPTAHVRKFMIELATEFGMTQGPERAQEMGMQTNKVPHRIHIHTPNYEIHADMYTSADATVESTLDLLKGSFVPTTMAVITPNGQSRDGAFSREFLLVNVDRIAYLSESAEAPPIAF
jgi:hypothetical protein